jgi:ribosomal-protein-alanine N-acetyltransferase
MSLVFAATVTPYHRRHLQAIHDLLFRTELAHTHLDWFETDAWLESAESQVQLAWQRGRLVGALGVSRPLNASTWIRFAAVMPGADSVQILRLLWNTMMADLREAQVTMAGLLGINDWTRRYASDLGFRYQEHIVTLERRGGDLPPPPVSPALVRVGDLRDLPDIVRVDGTAFEPPWQLSGEEMRQAFRMAASCTVALVDDVIVGYQISTLYFDGAHLARLAVVPAMQGRKVGAAILHDLLNRFARRSIHLMSVNTQSSNTRSRDLYTRFGFQTNGYDLPYYRADI